MRVLKIGSGYTIKESESLKQYLKDVSKIPLFASSEAEAECAQRAFGGDKRAIDELVSRNLRFVISVAKQHKTTNVLLDDLINEGNIGLLEAATKFDPSHGNKFISFAVWYIRKDIMKYVYTHERVVRVPLNKLNALNMLNNEICAAEQETGGKVSMSEIQERENLNHLTTSKMSDLLALSTSNTMSIDTPLTGGESTRYSDVMESKEFDDTDGKLINEQQLDRLNLLLDRLDYDTAFVVKMYYGIDCFYPLKLEEIGEILGLCSERVRQIKISGLKKLKELGNVVEFRDML